MYTHEYSHTWKCACIHACILHNTKKEWKRKPNGRIYSTLISKIYLKFKHCWGWGCYNAEVEHMFIMCRPRVQSLTCHTYMKKENELFHCSPMIGQKELANAVKPWLVRERLRLNTPVSKFQVTSMVPMKWVWRHNQHLEGKQKAGLILCTEGGATILNDSIVCVHTCECVWGVWAT